MRKIFFKFYATVYKYILKKAFFLLDPEFVHEFTTGCGEKIGNLSLANFLIGKVFLVQNKSLAQKVAGINFNNPIGLSAGFDYQAQLTKILPQLGFGFQTIGTITNSAYGGNLKPRLGRLPKSKSLMVNKGFKNAGIKVIIKKLQNSQFNNQVGLSIGKTNSAQKMTQVEAVADIVSAFKIAESSKIPFGYYELNISCPNLLDKVSFYPPENLKLLLKAVAALKLKKPLFIKMPIVKTDSEVRKMLDVIIKFPVAGVIFGNLQGNRKDRALNKEEVEKFTVGNFSGKPTEQRSNELIAMTYKEYGEKLVIIGCGGIFSASDAYKKIKLGATLVQLITGLIFEGPQLVAQINLELPVLLKKDGFKDVHEAIGSDSKLRS
jgi:dihydroorotate dehydrogenase subfamily 2